MRAVERKSKFLSLLVDKAFRTKHTSHDPCYYFQPAAHSSSAINIWSRSDHHPDGQWALNGLTAGHCPVYYEKYRIIFFWLYSRIMRISEILTAKISPDKH